MDPVGTITIGALIAALVAVSKALWPTTLDRRATLALVLVVSAVVLVLGMVSGTVGGTPFEIVAQWIMQALAAVGGREALVGVVPQAANGPTLGTK